MFMKLCNINVLYYYYYYTMWFLLHVQTSIGVVLPDIKRLIRTMSPDLVVQKSSLVQILIEPVA